jgi:transposase
MEQFKSTMFFAALMGIDWADEGHVIKLQETKSARIESFNIEQAPEQLHAWLSNLRTRFGGRPIAVAIEQSRGALISALLQYEFIVIYPIQPKALSKYREALRCSGAKDDHSDAELLLMFLQKHMDKLRGWTPEDELTRELRLLVEFRRKEVNHATRVSNQLTASLKQYYPQIFDLVGDLNSPLACDFLTNWPTLFDLQKVKASRLREFYNQHNCRSRKLLEQRLALLKTAVPLTKDRAIVSAYSLRVKALVRNLKQLIQSIQEFDEQIEHLMQQHPDREIYESLPGAGPVFKARMAADMGINRERFASAREIQQFVGTAPVTISSGRFHRVQRRMACPKFSHQTHVEFAELSLRKSAWALLYYQQKRVHLGHYAALRALAYKWDRILFRCWLNRTPYNEKVYIESLNRHGSKLAHYLLNTKN